VKIKSNEELFNDIYHLAAKTTSLASIVQNDTEITPEDYKEWALMGTQCINDIKLWMQKVYKHIQENQ